MKIVDPHIHLWDLSSGLYPGLETPGVSFIGNNAPIARSYLLDELLAEGGAGFEIVKIVHVEANPTDPVAETARLQALADRSGGFPQGIVAAADLSAPDVERTLERQRAFPNLRGIRQILNRHPDPLYNYVDRDFMSDPAWARGLRLLRQHGLSFDMQLYPHQMAEAAAIVSANPEIVFILNHAGMFADRGLAGWRQWRDGMRLLAERDNVRVKISGLGMLDHRWSVESIRPYVLETLDAFGVERAMFASNFPVDKLFSDYATVWRAFAKIVEDLSEDEKAALFRRNAETIYRIQEHVP